jgi:hypothetical protein
MTEKNRQHRTDETKQNKTVYGCCTHPQHQDREFGTPPELLISLSGDQTSQQSYSDSDSDSDSGIGSDSDSGIGSGSGSGLLHS